MAGARKNKSEEQYDKQEVTRRFEAALRGARIAGPRLWRAAAELARGKM